MSGGDPEPRPDRDRAGQATGQPPLIDASTWFAGHREVIIVHKGAQYRLRLTQSGKLILTK